jgi:hypothetical protein
MPLVDMSPETGSVALGDKVTVVLDIEALQNA